MQRKAIVLFSGGIDSTTALAECIQQGFQPMALSFDYGQRHSVELRKGREVLRQFPGAQSLVIHIDLRQIGGSALTSDLEVPKDRDPHDSIPVTYVPGRNLIFLSLAAAVGEVRGAYDLFYGANILDYSGYPDCRPEFIEALERTLNVGTKAAAEGKTFRIHAPLLKMSKAQIIRRGLELGVDYTHTHSCYAPEEDGTACGHCDSCRIRLKGFLEAGIPDPAAHRR
ncbi:MAG TPA: 7-cyano-7-deazaguanine synthase QueC [Acidobacteriota bacterium]|nr:7-cyano-7-deazaguanine synthase QueC [Acidobacteriota bacterium]